MRLMETSVRFYLEKVSNESFNISSDLKTYEVKIYYLTQLVSILNYLKSERVIHRDLKPSNILLNERW